MGRKNPVCFEFILGINLSPANTNLLTVFFFFFLCTSMELHLNKILSSNGILLNGILRPKLLNIFFLLVLSEILIFYYHI